LCGVHFRVRIKDDSVIRSLFKNSKGNAYTFKLNKTSDPISYAGNSMVFAESASDYSKVCIYFEDINPERIGSQNCFVGIDTGEELCSDIREAGEEKVIDIQDPCKDYGLFVPNCWGSTSGSGTGGTQTSGDDADPDSSPGDEGSPILDI
jgi:hypothetical protein